MDLAHVVGGQDAGLGAEHGGQDRIAFQVHRVHLAGLARIGVASGDGHGEGEPLPVIGVAKHSETLEEMVVYRALYGEGGLWVRPAAMWQESVTRDGVTQPRFTYIGD